MAESARPDKFVVLAKLLFEDHPLCVACLSAKAGLPVSDIEPTISRFEQTINVRRDMDRCRTCERWTLVYSLFEKRT
jgi:hypothetical protein